VTDFLDTKRREIADRLNELKPVVDEYGRLQAAASALANLDGSAPTATAMGRPPGRPKPRAASPKRIGRRAEETLKLVRAEPGITITRLSLKMDMNGVYLYKLLPSLAREGKVRKHGRGWHPIDN
jgi:hypothetical protein